MATNRREQLRAIRTFPSLVKYLRDELEWPIESDDFESLVFDFTPEELGIDKKNAAKIEEIKRLRPLTASQPWGIFFVKFDRKRLPVVALRRLLNAVALKKRASANPADQAAWRSDDLLFISNYGEEDDRKISFAHFSQNEEKKDLPVLKVLGWDDKDTALHLDDVADKLEARLTWDESYENAPGEWRNRWRAAFTIAHGEVVKTSKEMAVRLAELARKIRVRIGEVLCIESEKGPVRQLMAAFQEALIEDLDEDGFADMYAQTIAYGLLSARVTNPSGATLDDLAIAMPITNPFLKELMEEFLQVGGRKRGKKKGTGIDFDELGVSEVIALLDVANMEAVLRDFGDKNPQEDPVIHFFEGFLQEYDKKIRKDRGVFYTPRPVVAFIVRSVDELLRTEFGLKDGLADTTTWGEMADRIDDLEIPDGAAPDQAFVQILDPATGTGTFLVEVIDLIYNTMTEKWQAGGHGKKKIEKLWNDYAPEHLLPRLHGYELMMAPYAIAHMKIGLKLYETGYRFESDERARVYLTNALEPAQDFSGTLAFAIPALAHEAESVNAVKEDQKFTVVIGNPPYSAVSSNLTEDARALVEPYRIFDGEPIVERGALQFEKNINDDYVKFLRFAEKTVEQTSGIVGYITNNGYLETPTLRGMRQHLSWTFQRMTIVDLHGDSDRREHAPDGSADKNVFDIKRGVSVALFRRDLVDTDHLSVRRIDILGDRAHKYCWLQSQSNIRAVGEPIRPSGTLFLFAKQDHARASEYTSGIAINELFEVGSSGFESGRDELLLDFTKRELVEKVQFFSRGAPDKVREKFAVEKAWGKHLFDNRDSMTLAGNTPARITPVLMYPYDWRLCFYRKDLLKTNSWSAGQHLRNGQNLALMCMRQVVLDEPFTHVGVSSTIVNNRAFASQKGKVAYFPLFRDPESKEGLFSSQPAGANMRSEAMSRLLTDAENKETAPWKILHLITAQLFSVSFRTRYREFLIREFPRVFRPRSRALADALAQLGADLVALQLLDDNYAHASWRQDDARGGGTSPFAHLAPQYVGTTRTVDGVSYKDGFVSIDKGKTAGFKQVPIEAWDFQIGGYQVCQKWLKDRQAKGGKNPRPGRVLTDEDIEHYQMIVVAISETIRIMGEIDEVIEAHGGWPDAFVTEKTELGRVAEPRRPFG